ncbi:MAG: ATP-binding protein [Desulfobacteraceae bacterium]|jgi:PAS domain S-box-containing protein|nr:ATP-binding protein [Desulfobacteraceae bacterium]
MNIAVVGGGTRCKRLIEVIERHEFHEIDPRVVAVADLKDDTPGIIKAKENGLFVTHDYNDFFKRDDIDLIIELTGSMDIYNDILSKKKKTVRAIANRTAQLFWEISRVSTLQKKTDQELRETRARYQSIINELIQEDVMMIGFDYRIMDVNDSLLRRLGLERQDVIGRYCYEITHRQSQPCSGEKHPCPLIQTMETKKPFQTTHIHLDKDNREIYFSISTYPMLEAGDFFGAIEISRDITKDIKAQKTMMQQEKLASVGRLSAGVAHEINNPLTTILTTAMLIQEELDPQDPNYQELETITKETLRCRKIVASLLDFARQSSPARKPCDINAIVQESVTLTQKQAAFKDVILSDKLDEHIPRLNMDKGQILQSIINLILNAIEATDAGGSIVISTAYQKHQNRVDIAVEDTGHGINENDLGKIFDPFFTTKDEGTGLGLAITHGIIEQHNGTLDVDSKLGRGTRFTIQLPLNSGGNDAA